MAERLKQIATGCSRIDSRTDTHSNFGVGFGRGTDPFSGRSEAGRAKRR